MKKLFGQEGTSDVPSIATVLAKLQTNNPSVEDYEEGQEPSVAEKAGYQIEKEHCIYVRLIDFGQLREAKEAYKQEQWGVTVDKSEGNALSGKIRVRRSEDPNGNVSYELTVKNRAADGRSSIESTVPSTEEQFKQFKYMSDKGMVKHRYVFDAGNGKQWELDVAPNGDGGWYNWARLELEVDDLEAPLPKLPIKVEEVIMPREKSNLSPEEWKEKTDKIMNKYFVKKNAILENDSEEAKQVAQESFDKAEHVISTKHLTGLAVEGFMDTIKKLFRGERKPVEATKSPELKNLSKFDIEKIIKEIKAKCEFIGDIDVLKNMLIEFFNDEKNFIKLYEFEGILKYLESKNLDQDDVFALAEKSPAKILSHSQAVKVYKRKYAENKFNKCKELAKAISNESDAVKIIDMAFQYAYDNLAYEDMVDEYDDYIIDTSQVTYDMEQEKAEEFEDKYLDEIWELDWHQHEYATSNGNKDGVYQLRQLFCKIIPMFSYDDPTKKVATEGFFDSIKEMFSSKKDQPKEEPYEQTKVKGNLLDFMRAFNVNKFEVEEGTIDLNGLSTFSKQMLLKGDSVSTDLVKDIGDTVNWIDTVSKNNLPIFKSWAKELSNLNDNLDKLDGQADVNVLKGQIVNVFKSAKGSPDIVNNYKTNPNILGVNSLVTKNYRGDLSFIEPRNVFSGKVDTSKAKYNKLTKEQVIKLKSYYDHISSKINDFAFMEDVYTVDMTDAPIRAVYPELTDDDWKIIWAKKCYIVDVAGATFTNIIGILGEVKYGLLELIGGLIRESVSSNVSNEGFVDSVKDMFKNKYQDKTLNTLVKDMKNFTNEPAPKKLDADIEIILMSYHEYYVTNVKLAARKKLSMNVKRFKELSTNDPKALDAMSNEVLDEAKKADKGYWPVVDKVQKEVEKAHGWDKVNVLIKFLKETNGDKALYKAHGSIMLQAGVDDVADIYDESNKDDITITKVVGIVWNDNNDDYKVAAMDNPKLSKSLTKMCYKLNDIDN